MSSDHPFTYNAVHEQDFHTVNNGENRPRGGLSVILHGTVTGCPSRYDILTVGGVQRRKQFTAGPSGFVFNLRRQKYISCTLSKCVYLPTPHRHKERAVFSAV